MRDIDQVIMEGIYGNLKENYHYTRNCIEFEDGNEVQEITHQDEWEYPEETFGHDPDMQISKEEFAKMTGEGLKNNELAFWNQDMNIVFRYDPDKDVHYFYEN